MTAQLLLDRVLAALPRGEHEPLVAADGALLVPAESILDPDWLSEQIRLRGQRWRTDDPRVLATLWWYSASVWLPCPALTSLAVTGQALSPRLPDVLMHWWPDSRITGTTSAQLLSGDDQVAALGLAIREMLAAVIPPLAQAGRMSQRPLWAIASDSLANRLLWVGRAVGEVDRVTGLAGRLAQAIGRPLPMPRYVDVPATPPRTVRFTRRCSCCLLYKAPQQGMCSSCPKLAPADRQQRLEAAATQASY